MGWAVKRQRLVYEAENRTIIPRAEDVYSMLQGDTVTHEGIKLSSPADEVSIRFSKVGGTICLHVFFVEKSNSINLELYFRKSKNQYPLLYEHDDLPDSVIADGTWYNLLSNFESACDILKATGIQSSGTISLSQYIKLLREATRYSDVPLVDDAHEALSNHPAEDLSASMPATLKATLYPYQQRGYQWLRFISNGECGCILGDEMGLGKTLQVIALITERLRNEKRPSLVVAPVSLLENWRREIGKFTTGVRAYIHHGSKRTGLYTELLNYDVIIISYNTAVSDLAMLRMINWDLLILDEAQNIKNPAASRTKSVKRIPRHTAIAVSGTPFENHVSDLWSLLDFISPGSFGRLTEFEAEISDDVDGARKIEPMLTPLMLRRRVSEVAQDLPERIDVPQVLQMTPFEISQYEEEREKILNEHGAENATLPMLQQLRMFCTHPDLLSESTGEDPTHNCSKYERLCELLEEIIALREKVILFTSYNKMFDILTEDIPSRFGIRVFSINGSTPTAMRQGIIDEFSSVKGTALLVLNPRAAGTGLNITAATRVIHYNLEWNPSLEDQASARAYRRGQTKTVFIYRLFYRDTVEQVINERIEKKRDMFSAAVIGVDGTEENREDIMRALTLTPGGGNNE